MGRRGEATRERILAVAEAIVLQQGYSATSIDAVIANAGITKSGFFYHFKSKNQLAKGLLERYVRQDDAVFSRLFARADSLSEDPLQRFLIFLKLLEETMANLESNHPGCIVAAYCYECEQIEPEVLAIMKESVLSWRRMFTARLDEIAALYPPRYEVVLADVADMATSGIEGGIILSKVIDDKNLLPRQIAQYRNYVRALFEPAS
ncbi:MAG: TetR/AcrR family transcriptional regulator [Myxococcales bacterium FL481]|nr:MAG: TetR/AcrR family transcriptional regulator [Myxococcales bacterium FL481]